MSLRPGDEWGAPVGDEEPALVVSGTDTDLASALAGSAPGLLVRFEAGPESDLARALGVAGRGAERLAVPLDLLDLGAALAVSTVVVGIAPDRLRPWHRPRPFTLTIDGGRAEVVATTIVVATGQFLRGLDVNPRSHPGDGAAEVQVYAVPSGERSAMRARLATGAHLPHPRISVRRARAVTVKAKEPFPVAIDGRTVASCRSLAVDLRPGAYRLLV